LWPFTLVPGVIWFTLKEFFVFFMFALVKAFVPRYRYDQLMRIGWKVFLPISLAMVAIVAGVLQFVVYDAAARSDAKPAGTVVERVVPK
jgi:NADH-quinone oxidoreductase subunit H